jgi:hypothetical protein
MDRSTGEVYIETWDSEFSVLDADIWLAIEVFPP